MATVGSWCSWWSSFVKYGYECDKYSDEEVVVFLWSIDNDKILFDDQFVVKMRNQSILRGLGTPDLARRMDALSLS